jgi:hypothetical protein
MNDNIGQSRVYGGVCILPIVKSGHVEPSPQTSSFPASTELSFNNIGKIPNRLLGKSHSPYYN